MKAISHNITFFLSHEQTINKVKFVFNSIYRSLFHEMGDLRERMMGPETQHCGQIKVLLNYGEELKELIYLEEFNYKRL